MFNSSYSVFFFVVVFIEVCLTLVPVEEDVSFYIQIFVNS